MTDAEPPSDTSSDPAPPSADPLHRLLEVQDLDLAADQLRHRREAMPERERLAFVTRAVADHQAAIGQLRADRDAHLASQLRAEDELEGLVERAAAEERKLYGGGVTAVREVDAIQAELGTISRRRSDLEDQVLTDMEAIDDLGRSVTTEEDERSRREREVAELIGIVGAAEAAIDSELAANVAEREGLADGLTEDLLATYERLRARLGGVAVARLEGGHCLGCHLALPATEVDAFRRAAPGTVFIHEECGRILVR
jgi:hypothetical protein